MSAKKLKVAEAAYKEYRELAPERITDTELNNLINSNNNDREKILVAIQNLWNDTPDRLAQGVEWVTLDTSRNKKSGQKENDKPGHSDNSDGRGRGRGGRGEGRGGRGGRGNSDRENSSNDASRSRNTSGRGSNYKVYKSSKSDTTSPKPEVSAPTSTVQTASSGWDAATPGWDVVTPGWDVQPVAPADPIVSTSISSGESAWKSGMSFAEKLKRADAEKQRQKELEALKAAEAERQQQIDSYSEPYIPSTQEYVVESEELTSPETTDMSTEADYVSSVVADLTLSSEQFRAEELHPSLEEEDPILLTSQNAPLLIEPSPVKPSVTDPVNDDGNEITDPYIKLGQWASVQQPVPFQFGNFGKETDDVTQAGWSTGGIDVDTRQDSAEAWNATNPSSASSISNALFNQTKSVGSVPIPSTESTTKFDQKPPGLGEPSKINATVTNTTRLPATQSRVAKSNETSPPQGLTQQYPQTYPTPPGFANASQANANQRGTNSATPPNMAFYAYDASYGGFGYPVPNIVPPNVSAVGSGSTSTPSTNVTAGQQGQQQQPVQQQQQPYPQFPYYQPQFYNQPYYYPQSQIPGYFNQRGAVYQPRGYGDPYSTPVYDMYSQGQPFVDVTYSGMTPSTGSVQSAAPAAGAKNPKPTQTATNAPTGVASQGGMTVPDNSGIYGQTYGVNPNPYGGRDMQGAPWGYQQTAWGAPMMGFPTSPGGQAPVSQGFGQQGTMNSQPQQPLPQQSQTGQTQSTQSGRDSTQRTNQVSGNNYGSGSFGRPSGSATGTTTGQTQW